MRKKCLYLHVPKTAGSALNCCKISQKIKFKIHPISPLGAWKIIESENKQGWFKAAFVRNPWDRFISLYFYFYNMQPDHFAYKYDSQTVENIQRFPTFEDFCLNFTDFDEAQPFKKFHFFNQHLWTHNKGKCFVDFLGRYENLNSDLFKLEDIVGAPHCRLPHANASPHTHYAEHYTPRTIDIVADLYKDDIDLLNYDQPQT